MTRSKLVGGLVTLVGALALAAGCGEPGDAGPGPGAGGAGPGGAGGGAAGAGGGAAALGTEIVVKHVDYLSSGDAVAFLASGLVVLDAGLGTEKARVGYPGPAGDFLVFAGISRDGQTAAVLRTNDPIRDGGTVTVFAVPSGQILMSTTYATTWLPAVLSPGGDLLAVVGTQLGDGAPVTRVYDTASGAVAWQTEEIQPPLAFSVDGTELYASGSTRVSVGGWNARSGANRFLVEQPLTRSASSFQATPDGSRLRGVRQTGMFINDEDLGQEYASWRISDGAVDEVIPQLPNFGWAWSVVEASDGEHWAALAIDINAAPPPNLHNAVQVWSRAGTELYTIHDAFGGNLAFSPGGAALLAVPLPNAAQQDLRLYRVADGTLIASHRFASVDF